MILTILLTLFLSHSSVPTIAVSHSFGFAPLRVTVRVRLPEHVDRVCIRFQVDGSEWSSCFADDPRFLSYQRSYTLDVGDYTVFATTESGSTTRKSESLTIIVEQPGGRPPVDG